MKKIPEVFSWIVVVLVFLFLQAEFAQTGNNGNGALFSQMSRPELFRAWLWVSMFCAFWGAVCGVITNYLLKVIGWCMVSFATWIVGLAGKKVVEQAS